MDAGGTDPGSHGQKVAADIRKNGHARDASMHDVYRGRLSYPWSAIYAILNVGLGADGNKHIYDLEEVSMAESARWRRLCLCIGGWA